VTLGPNSTSTLLTTEQFLAADNRFSSFMSALAVTFPLGTELEAPFGETFTVFAPTNAAFDKLTRKSLIWLLGNRRALTKVLLKHVVAGSAVRIPSGYSKLNTVGGSRITLHRYVDGNGREVVEVRTSSGAAKLEQFGILTSDGY
jgi:transforming growth factor-beta-induced protein